jgi:ParB family chromosome partitioning protein
LVQIETAWRSPKEQRPGTLNKNQYRELAEPDNPDAEPPCPSAKAAIIVFGKNVGRTVTVCLDDECPVHTNHSHHAHEEDVELPPVMAEPPDEETEEEAAQRKAEHEQRMAEYQAEQQRKEDERKAEFERQQKEYEAEQARRDKLRKARVSTLERIIEAAPTSFSAEQTRMFLRLLIHINPYDFLENVASYFTSDDENAQQSDDEVLLAALGNTADEKLNGLALRIVLTDHVGIPHENQPDLLTETETVFDPKKPKAEKDAGTKKAKSTGIKAAPKKTATAKKAA